MTSESNRAQPTQDDLISKIVAAGISDRRLIEAFTDIPRSDFVPDRFRHIAYQDGPIIIAESEGCVVT